MAEKKKTAVESLGSILPVFSSTKPTRPPVLAGVTVKATTGCGNMYVQLNWYKGVLFEVFATLGRGGGCAICQSEAITRSITLGLKHGLPLEEYIDQLRNIRCPSPVPFPRESAVTSCPDAIAKVLRDYGGMSVVQVADLLFKINDIDTYERRSNGPLTPQDEEAEMLAAIASNEKQAVAFRKLNE